MTEVMRLEGAGMFRQRLIMATLSGRAIKITGIRSKADNPGIKDYEASFLRLMDKLTNGSKININATGTAVSYKPGLVEGGNTVHTCPNSRALGYYLEALVCLAPFAKKSVKVTLHGITNDNVDPSVDMFRTVTLPVLRSCGIEGNMELKIVKRGAAPNGGGEVTFSCDVIQKLNPIRYTELGKIKRIRGIAYVTRMSPQTANRIVDSARGVLNDFIPDIYIYSDHYKGAESGKSPGFACLLVAEATNGVLVSAEYAAAPGQTPEDVGTKAAQLLCEEIARGGSVDTATQPFVLLFMALATEDVSKIRFGMLTPYTVEFLRNLKQFFGVVCKLQPDQQDHSVMVTCKGIGFTNLAKRIL